MVNRINQFDFPEHGVAIDVEDFGEHHRDAARIEFAASRPLCGLARWATTNGQLLVLPDRSAVLLCDHCVIVLIDFVDNHACYLEPPRMLGLRAYFSKIRLEGRFLVGEVYGVFDWRRPLEPMPWNELRQRFFSGWGPVVNGRFPSAVGID